ncbi:ABC transporter ATP-binding protein [Mycoplasma anatis]|uniref:ABC transporter ATP-binding protein n=1 Tax=Mycoplasmopsis anatis TaxID=171279 RepID=A0A9Q3L8H1_9BACT|nr:ABC transporter ATP-binding protein [Mycoplasmopsis anatis]MBW0596399.1 ABC transporter ATP-binding protein [Mycoplasmopsis anatis]MBW0596517.1 ABC transporter ATP-binding protein [Mycoplasmopsis anatis]MBW0597859.1 ABC transporter ATP-binding protein [Mycoplasmopsis anatis]MBW0599895.1 ABC transporter ATP-binding protein [Mycoplasmopsis anatis]MBW0600781.1 ABC transporter ATP-binding protein [Mycoplasmopsis anatis]
MLRIIKLFSTKLKFTILITVVFNFIPSFVIMLIPSLIRQFIEYANTKEIKYIEIFLWKFTSNSQAIDNYNLLIIITLISAFLLFVCNLIPSLLNNYILNQTRYETRKIMFNKIIKLKKEQIDSLSYARIMTLFSNDIRKIVDGIYFVTKSILQNIFNLIWGLVFSITLSILYSISIFVLIPLIIIISSIIIYKIFPLFRKENAIFEEINDKVKEDINLIQLVKSYNLEDDRYEIFNKSNNRLYDISLRANRLNITAWRFNDFSNDIATIIVFLVGGLLIYLTGAQKSISEVGKIYQFNSYMWIISSSIFSLSQTINSLTRSQVSAKRYLEVLNIESEEINSAKDIKLVSNEIEFKNVSFRYSNSDTEQNTLKNISFKIPSNKTVGVIGKTGSGKSTLALLLVKELKPTEGEIFVGGDNINDIDYDDFHSKVSQVFQKPLIFSGTIKENIEFSTRDNNSEIIEKSSKVACLDFVNNYDKKFDQVIGQRGINLSGGQKQRIAIAQAILKNPKILVLDDTTSALDNKTDLIVRKNLANSLINTTVFIISQKINSISNADTIIVLDAGRIVDQGTHSELLSRCEIYKEFASVQKENHEE